MLKREEKELIIKKTQNSSSMSKENETVLICSNHNDYHTPLIMTFKFMGAEYWCPHCGETYGFFGNYVEVQSDKELVNREKLFKELSKKFLGSDGIKFQYNQKPDQP